MKRSALRRTLLCAALLGALSGTSAMHLAFAGNAVPIEVYKNEYCGCCTEWVKHLESNGFKVKVHTVANPSDYREKAGIPKDLGSCHTGFVQGYALEGHVPATEIRRLLAEKPKAKGLAVPAMPMGAPGMEGHRKDPFDVLLVRADGSTSVYRHYN